MKDKWNQKKKSLYICLNTQMERLTYKKDPNFFNWFVLEKNHEMFIYDMHPIWPWLIESLFIGQRARLTKIWSITTHRR